jgi:hypothetical protein
MKDKVNSLIKHLENYKNRLTTGIVPERRRNQVAAYKEYLMLEIKRTERRIAALTGVYVESKKK